MAKALSSSTIWWIPAVPPWRSAKCIPKRTLSPFSPKPAGRPLVDDYVVDIPQDTGLNSRGIWAWCLYRLSQVVNSSGQCYLPRPACRAWFLSFSRLQYPEWHYDGDCTCHRLTSAKRCLNLASNIPKLLRWCVGFLPENPGDAVGAERQSRRSLVPSDQPFDVDLARRNSAGDPMCKRAL